MKNFSFLIFLLIGKLYGQDMIPATMNSTPYYSITVDITKLRPSQGEVALQVLDEKENVVRRVVGRISDGTSVIVIDSLPRDTYAIQYFHDANGDRVMNFNGMKIPTEGYGFSNNARGFFGPPDFDDQLFDLNKNMNMKLKTAYAGF